MTDNPSDPTGTGSDPATPSSTGLPGEAANSFAPELVAEPESSVSESGNEPDSNVPDQPDQSESLSSETSDESITAPHAPAHAQTKRPLLVRGVRHAGSRLKSALSTPEGIVTAVVVAAACVFTFIQLQPSNIFANTTPSGGDMGAHVWFPAFVENHLLPHFRITGWTMDNYDGFPALTFYFPFPILAIVAASAVMPYDIAFKLVSASGMFLLPLAAWGMARISKARFPYPAVIAAATVPFLFNRDYTIYGGNIASTMAGEFSFGISLCFALLFLGLMMNGLQTGRFRALAAVALLLTGLSHLLPTAFAGTGAVVLTIMAGVRTKAWRSVLRWSIPTLGTAALLSAWWSVPFEARLKYASNMGYEKVTNYVGTLFPSHDLWLFALAAAGAALSYARRSQLGIFFSIMAVLSGLALRYMPNARLWNARILPFWYLSLYLLAGLAVAELLIIAARRWSSDRLMLRATLLPVPLVLLVLSLIFVGFPLRILPGGHVAANGNYDWLGISSGDQSFIPSWVTWNYSGYQDPGKARRDEYQALVAKMKQVGAQYGCGTAMWEYEPELDQMGTPDALMLLPYWTNGCVGSMEGLYYEASGTTPYHFLDASELSLRPSNPMRGLPYPSSPDVAEGVKHLQMLGVKYYMALTPQMQSQADADSSLRLISTVGPFSVTYSNSSGNGPNGRLSRTWKIYEILDSAPVAPLVNQPVVIKGMQAGGLTWQNQMVGWWMDPSNWSVLEAASGPSNWAKLPANVASLPQKPLPPVSVSGIVKKEESIDFNVSKVGVPVVVKTSFFPNWKVSGAKGPYRVSPNLMVVVPTSTHVHMYYGYTLLDVFDYLLSAFGIVCLVLLARRKPVVMTPRIRSDEATTASPVLPAS